MIKEAQEYFEELDKSFRKLGVKFNFSVDFEENYYPSIWICDLEFSDIMECMGKFSGAVGMITNTSDEEASECELVHANCCAQHIAISNFLNYHIKEKAERFLKKVKKH